MAELQINSFSKGLQKDLAKEFLAKEMYIDARNWHLISEAGSSSGILENVNGNKLSFTFPDTSPVYKIVKVPNVFVGNPVVTINFVSSQLFNHYNDSDIAFYKALADLINLNYTNLGIVAVENEESVLVYSTTLTSFTLTTIGALTVTTEVPSQTNLRIIGWDTMRDDFIILTCSNNNPSTGGPGQIWRLRYDFSTIGSTFSKTLTLLYNNQISFSKEHPVASPGAIIARYENTNIQNAYWTNNFHKPKKFNTIDPKGFAIPPVNLDMFPSVDFSVPILDLISTGGTLLSGTYQVTYRLKTSSGQESTFSSLSNMIPISGREENNGLTDLRNYYGIEEGLNTVKKFKFTVREVDTDYKKIEIAVIRWGSSPDIPEDIILKPEEPVSNNGINTFEVANLTGSSLTVSELLAFKGNKLDRFKTMTSKDNVLVVGNIKESSLILDYDARARRYNLNSTSYSIEPNPDEGDDINPNQDFNSSTAYLYQSDGLTVGGSGIDISYKIKQSNFFQDSYYVGSGNDVNGNNFNSLALSGSMVPPAVPFKSPDKRSHFHSLGVANQTYFQDWFFDTYLSPYNHGLFKGYMRDETYRFGIVFFDKNGNPGFVHWIGDIRMPQMWDSAGLRAFPVCNVYNSEINMNNGTFNYTRGSVGGHYSTRHTLNYQINYFGSPITGLPQPWTTTHPLYLQFTVNIPTSIRSQIGGFSIVRAERKKGDRSIVSQGVIFPTTEGNNEYVAGYIDGGNFISELILNNNFVGFFPEDFFNDDLSLISGDRIKPVSTLGLTVQEPIATLNTNTPGAQVIKLYDARRQSSISSSLINSVVKLGLNDDASIINDYLNIGSTVFHNYGSDSETYAQKSLLLGLQDTAATFVNSDPQFNKSTLVNWVRNISSSQYGGNTISQRSNTDYISCGHFQPINNNSPTSFTFDLYGGDTFVPIWDFQRVVRARPGFTGRNLVSDSEIDFVPLETTIDIDMREGVTGNRAGLAQFADTFNSSVLFNNANPLANVEDIVAHPHFDYENNLRKFSVQPVDFVPTKEFDNLIRASQAKTNGEVDDSWTNFALTDQITVDGKYGPINNLVAFKDTIIFFQDNAFGTLSVFPRSVTQDQSGDLQLASGAKLEDWDYISNEVGCFHQWGMTQSDSGIFFYDAKRRKIYIYNGQSVNPYSDVKGLQSYLYNTFIGNLNTTDNPIVDSGVTATFDYRFNEAIFTFKDKIPAVFGKILHAGSSYTWIIDLPKSFTDTLSPGNIIVIVNPNGVTNNISVQVVEEDRIKVAAGLGSFAEGISIQINSNHRISETVALNEQIGAFTSFYDYKPSLYLNNKRVILSPNPANERQVYIHNFGNKGNYYGTYFPSTVQCVVNPHFNSVKVFDNLSWLTETFDASGNELSNVTHNQLKARTGYQDGGTTTLVPNSNIRRRERIWSMSVPRGKERERLRDVYMEVDLSFTNNVDRKMLFHFLNTHFRRSSI